MRDLELLIRHRHLPKSGKPPIMFSSSVCEVCQKIKTTGNHDRCSKIKQKRMLQANAQAAAGIEK